VNPGGGFDPNNIDDGVRARTPSSACYRDVFRLLLAPLLFRSPPRSCFDGPLPFSCGLLLLRPGMWTSMAAA